MDIVYFCCIVVALHLLFEQLEGVYVLHLGAVVGFFEIK